MPLSRLYKETIKARVEREPEFRTALFEEAEMLQDIRDYDDVKTAIE